MELLGCKLLKRLFQIVRLLGFEDHDIPGRMGSAVFPQGKINVVFLGAGLDLWFPDNRRTEECVSAYASLYPLITYYLNRLNDWGLCFRRCKVCGKYFLAKSQRYELCSDKCRKAQALQNKREFDERSRENNYDLLYKNECQNWRNKINRVKNTAGFPADRLEKIQASFSDFKKEALQRKKAVKTGTASPKEFADWLYQQSNVIVELTEY